MGGLGEIWQFTREHLKVSILAVVIACAVAVPIGLWLGHIGKGQFIAGSVANIGRAVPSLAIIAFFVAFLGSGFTNVCFALILLAIPPILTNTYVGVRQVDRDTVDAARGQVLGDVVEDLRPVVPRGLRPAGGRVRRFHRVADVLPVAPPHLADPTPGLTVDTAANRNRPLPVVSPTASATNMTPASFGSLILAR